MADDTAPAPNFLTQADALSRLVMPSPVPQLTEKHVRLYSRLAKLSIPNIHLVFSAVRGPDKHHDSDVGDDGLINERDIKSVTALVVRRALYGPELAADISSPNRPAWDRVLKLSNDEWRAAVDYHYVVHQHIAFTILGRDGLFHPDDADHAMLVLRRLTELRG